MHVLNKLIKSLYGYCTCSPRLDCKGCTSVQPLQVTGDGTSVKDHLTCDSDSFIITICEIFSEDVLIGNLSKPLAKQS